MNLPGCLCLFDCSEVCKKDPECDYYFSIDSDVALTNPDILRILMEENKYVEALFTPSVKPWAYPALDETQKLKRLQKNVTFVDKFLKTDSQYLNASGQRGFRCGDSAYDQDFFMVTDPGLIISDFLFVTFGSFLLFSSWPMMVFVSRLSLQGQIQLS